MPQSKKTPFTLVKATEVPSQTSTTTPPNFSFYHPFPCTHLLHLYTDLLSLDAPDSNITIRSMKTVSKVLEEAFAPLKDALKRGDAESFKLFEELDDYTVRGYLREKMYVVPSVKLTY